MKCFEAHMSIIHNPMLNLTDCPINCLHYFWSTLFHSLEWNRIGDSGAAALADALTVNQSLTTLK